MASSPSIRLYVPIKQSRGYRCSGSSGKVLPVFILVAVGVVADALGHDAGDLIPHARALHLKSQKPVLPRDPIAVLARPDHCVAGTDASDEDGWCLRSRSVSVELLFPPGLQALSFECPSDLGEAEFQTWAAGAVTAAKRVARSVLVYGAGSLGLCAVAILRTGSGGVPAKGVRLPQTTTPASGAVLKASAAVSLPQRNVDRTLTMELSGSMSKYDWAINGTRLNMSDPLQNALEIAEGERVALEFRNTTTMWHPMHLHGHTYQHAGGGPRKDTSIVFPGQTLRVEFDADNPGRWLTHCHNIYHGEAGMMAAIAYRAG